MTNSVAGAVASSVRGVDPVVRCAHPAEPDCELTPERVAEILLDQEVEQIEAR